MSRLVLLQQVEQVAVEGESQVSRDCRKGPSIYRSNIRGIQELAEGLELRARLSVSHGVAEPLGPAKAHATQQTMSESVQL